MGIKRKAPHHGNTRRQWGSDHRDQPIPIVAPPISDRRIMIGRLAIVLTVSAWFTYVFLTIVQQFVEGDASSARLVIEAIVYIIVVTALTASAMAYLITRIGFFYRSRAHHRAPRAEIDHFFTQSVPTVTVLVPSYQEDERVIRTTLLSAAILFFLVLMVFQTSPFDTWMAQVAPECGEGLHPLHVKLGPDLVGLVRQVLLADEVPGDHEEEHE